MVNKIKRDYICVLIGITLSLSILTGTASAGVMGVEKAMYKLDGGIWTTGNAGSTIEGEWISYQYLITKIDPYEPLPKLNITYPIFVEANDGIYFDVVSNMLYCIDNGTNDCQDQGKGSLPDGTPRPTSLMDGWINFTPTLVNEPHDGCINPNDPIATGTKGVDSPCETHYFMIEPGSGGVPANISSDSRITFFFEFHLAQTPLWINALEANFGAGEANEIFAYPNAFNTDVLGDELYGNWTNPFGGAGIASIGSSQHVNIEPTTQGSQGISQGALTLPIPTVAAIYESTISGQKFEDLNGDGIKDLGEIGLARWNVTLAGTLDGGVAVSFPITTGDNGYYSITNVYPGNYTLTETQQAGYVQTAPNNTQFDELPNGNPLPSEVEQNGGIYYVNISSGTGVDLVNIDFCNQ